MEAGRPRGLRVRTACETEAELVTQFHRNCDDESVFAPTTKMIPEGADCAFSIELAGGEPMVRGLGVVIHSWPTGDNPFGAAGVHIAIAQLTTGTQPIFDRLLDARARAEGRPLGRSRPARITQLRFPVTAEELERSTNEFEDESIVHEVRRTITQEMQAAPVEMIDERASHTIRYEGPLRSPAAVPPRVPLPPPRRPAPAMAAQEPAALPDPPTYPGPPPFAEPPTMPEASAFARGTPVPPEAVVAGSPVLATPRSHPVLAAWRTVTARLAPAWAWIRTRLAPLGTRLEPLRARLATWSAPARARVRPAWTRVVARLRPLSTRVVAWLRPLWMRVVAWLRPVGNARVAVVFAAGILVGILASSWMRPKSEPPRVTVAAAAPVQCTPAPPAIAAPVVASAAPAATIAKPAAPKPPVPAKKPPAIAKTTAAPKPAPKPPAAPPRVTVAATPAPKPVVAAKPPAKPTSKAVAAAKPKKTRCSTLDCL